MTNKELIEDLLIEFDEFDMQPMIIVPDPLDRAKAWKHELTYAIKHLEAEVAREIFSEIEKVLKEYHKPYGLFGEFRTRAIMEALAELKKKYTEGAE